MGKIAILLGATGLTGNILLNKLLLDERYDKVVVISRKSTGLHHPKLVERNGDILDLKKFKDDFKGDEVFCCIGTTAKNTPDRSLYKKIDHGIPAEAAKLAKTNQIHTFLVISALGANSKSSIFYNKIKGEMEESVLTQKIPNTYILRPSIILGNRNEKRFGERIGILIIQLISFLLIGKLKKYRAIEADKIAQAMINLANSKPNLTIINSDRINEIGNSN